MGPESLPEQSFLNKFEPDGDDFILRITPSAPGTRVTRAERDLLLGERKKRALRLTWMVIAVAAPAIIIGGVADYYLHDSTILVTVADVVVLVALIFVLGRAHTSAERRALEQFVKGRPIAAPARLTKEERLRAHFKQVSWSQLGGFAVLVVAMLLRSADRYHLLVWQNRFWLFGGGVSLLGVFGAGAYRKWRWSREE